MIGFTPTREREVLCRGNIFTSRRQGNSVLAPDSSANRQFWYKIVVLNQIYSKTVGLVRVFGTTLDILCFPPPTQTGSPSKISRTVLAALLPLAAVSSCSCFLVPLQLGSVASRHSLHLSGGSSGSSADLASLPLSQLAMKSVLVTGANKGIGFATVQKILESTDCAVFLGSRDATRGASAVAQLVKKNPEYATRVSALEIDVSSDESVKKAAEKVMATFGEEPQQLFGIVNNAGVLWEDTIKPALETNVYGMKRVNDAFSPMLRKEDGRIINIGSASGPVFVAECSAQRKKIFNNPAVTWADVEALIAEVLSAEVSPPFVLSCRCEMAETDQGLWYQEKGTLNKLGLGDWGSDSHLPLQQRYLRH